MCATEAQYACNDMYFGLNVWHTNYRIINTVPCVNSCKLDKYNYIFHTDNIDYEISAYRHMGKLLYRCSTSMYVHVCKCTCMYVCTLYMQAIITDDNDEDSFLII